MAPRLRRNWAHPRALQLLVRVEVKVRPTKAKLAWANGNVAPGNPFGAGQQTGVDVAAATDPARPSSAP